MAVCPNCHQMDKNFFAPLCHNCNTHVGFWEQVAHSLLFTVVSYGTIALGMYIIWLAVT
jgi:uncharacterized protein (DUF983 family)